MEQEKIGKFIAKLRKTQNMTQQELSLKLLTSRENISKWERGINMPTPDSLMLLSEIFNVSVNEILLGEYKTLDNQKEIDNVSINILKEYNKKLKRLLRVFIIEVVVVVLGFISYYIYNMNSQEVYLVSGDGDLELNEGLAVLSLDKSYLKLGSLKNDIKNYTKVEYHYKNNEEDKLVLTTNSLDYVLISNKKFDNYIDYKDIKNIINNSYLKLVNENNNQEYLINLDFIKE